VSTEGNPPPPELGQPQPAAPQEPALNATSEAGAPAADAEADQSSGPHRVTLVDHARISAELAEGTRPQAEVLEQHGLTEEQWTEATSFWMLRLAEDVKERATLATLPLQYSDAFAQAQAELAPVKPMTPEEWATLTVEIQRAGPTQPLAARNLSSADYTRLARHFAQTLATDPLQNERFLRVYLALQG
jgi:hypothetical protein